MVSIHSTFEHGQKPEYRVPLMQLFVGDLHLNSNVPKFENPIPFQETLDVM